MLQFILIYHIFHKKAKKKLYFCQDLVDNTDSMKTVEATTIKLTKAPARSLHKSFDRLSSRAGALFLGD